ncbi:MAG: formylglycine-generating enzyme family protein, partial [Sphingobacteriaceae bacterium]|nr:formylglycine-generating enzyme family protein [Sphingobacteriaceae bacterium]
DFGLYNMAGNVNEWVSDVYRVGTFEDSEALNPFRGNVFQNKAVNPENGLLVKNRYNQPIKTDAVTPKKQSWTAKLAGKIDTTIINFKADVRGEKDRDNDGIYGEITLINNRSRVYKGGGWNDQVLWLTPAARRHMQQDDSAADIGFRCAMTMLGNSEVSTKGKPQFKIKPSKPFNAKR